MIEIKVTSNKKNENTSEIRVEGCAKHSGTYGEFVDQVTSVLAFLDKTDREVFNHALRHYLTDRVVESLKESEGENE